MGKLLPEIWNLKPGDEASPQRLLVRRKKPVTELRTWVQCFAIYVGVVSLKHPEVIADMMAYMVMIVKAAEEYAGLAWVRYKPEPIMLLILPIILSRISQIFYPLFSMPSPIIPIVFFKFLLCL